MAKATDAVMQQQEAVRRSGKTNMMDRSMVQRIAFECDYHDLVAFIEECDADEYVKMAEDAVEWYRGQELSIDPVPEKITMEVEI